MPEWCPRKHKPKADRSDDDKPGFENKIEQEGRNIEEDSRWYDDGTEKPNNTTRKLKGDYSK